MKKLLTFIKYTTIVIATPILIVIGFVAVCMIVPTLQYLIGLI